MTSTLRVTHTLTWDPPEVAGGAHLLSNGSKIYLHGTGVPLINDIAEALNLTVEHSYLEYNASVVFVANGSADVGSLSLTTSNIFYTKLGIGTTLAYLHPIAMEPSRVFFRQPPTSQVTTTIFRPFKTIAWIVMLLLNFFISALITSNAKPTCFSLPFIIKFMVNALYLTVARISLHKGNAKTSPSCNFRARTTLVKAFFSVVFISLYTAKFVSVFVQTEQPIKSPEDLIKYDYVFCSYSPMHIDRIFSKPEIRNIVNARVHPVNGETIDKVIGKDKKNPKQALLSLPDGFYPQALFGLKYGKEICQVSWFESTVKTSRCPYVRKNSPFREPINLKILQMIERGLNYRLQKNHQRKFLYTCPNQISTVNPIYASHITIGYLVLFLGHVFAIILNFVKY